MKKLFLSIIAISYSVFLLAQIPTQFKYQAVLRNTDGTIMAEENVTVVVSILKSDLTTSVFEETHSTTTTIHGLINLNIGSIEDLNTINWTMDEYFIEISINETVMGTSQLLSVPYSLHAKTAETITGTITENQISDLDHFTTTDETDPVYNASVASEITSTDTSYWNDKLDSYNEIDPLFDASVASGVTSTDTANWNNKSEFDGDFSSLYNSPNLANTTLEKNIPLNTNDATSSLNITKNNGASVMKVDGTGRITGDGSGLSNVKPLLNYVGGDQRYQITANYGTYNNVRSVTMTAPSNGVCFVMASGYVDWESINWDVLLLGILCDQDPNISWIAEDEWYHYLNILTDYNCPDSSDQYTSFAQHRCIPVSAGMHTFYLWANKHSAMAKVKVADVNLSVMFFPTGGTGKSTNNAVLKEDEPVIKRERIPNTVSGYN
ncbi:MAG TPA: hypothetical protein VJ937_07585 [Salinivirga sp.]|uniref:hypothetical protein n=1 Tax=Salinivirga sp. TaxID=1970192 RepID=UPI002B4A720F|nr:hypothetical protein [Salinivirga sp.]HKK59324.1 hypothetical protein [Salinivirga sp.]